MAMKRRRFLKLSIGAIIGAPLAWVVEKVAPTRYTEALRARFYPGAIRTTDLGRISRPGRWAG